MSNLPEEPQSADQETTGQQPTGQQDSGQQASGQQPAGNKTGAATPAVTPPAARPQPAFGEYAPEGWEWKPEGSDKPAEADAPAASAGRSTGGAIAGVPHNLGAANSASASATAPVSPSQPGQQTGSQPQGDRAANTTGDPAPYRANNVPAAPPAYAAPAMGANATTPSRTGDRVMTIILLGIGVFGVIFSFQVMMGMKASFVLMGEALEIKDFEVPAWVGTLGTISALGFLALFAVTLIFSIQRMRARKVAFWVPLTAGVIAFIAMIVLIMVAIFSSPELMDAAADPGANQKILDYLYSTTP
ncbi:hypothetical protein G7068_06020 [Leucobacter viscericola]|uniref:Uncharacterized protein n=1 Tax=Leucobacter viscericola TaxID=2714935 RepID=A0A6G7XDY4_9MICO|nr:DUF6264 family protein [Leucobacter viscericola]QIK62804.1 hypothetical protein G7068_06020 [Leucobacter viscericola]